MPSLEVALSLPSLCAEKFQRLPGRRCVEDDAVVVALVGDLEEALRRHVLEHSGQVGGEPVIESVGENPLARLLVRSVAVDQPVECPPRVEQARVQRARGVGLDPGHVLGGFEPHSKGVFESQRGVESHHQGVVTGAR